MKVLVCDFDKFILKNMEFPEFATEIECNYCEMVAPKFGRELMYENGVFFVDEDGLNKSFYVINNIPTKIYNYGFISNVQPIVGKAIFAKYGLDNNGEWDVVGLDKNDIIKMLTSYCDIDNECRVGVSFTIDGIEYSVLESFKHVDTKELCFKIKRTFESGGLDYIIRNKEELMLLRATGGLTIV